MKRENKGALLLTVMLGLCAFAINPSYSEEIISVDSEQEVAALDEVKTSKALDKAEELISQKRFEDALTILNSYIEAKPKKYQGYKLRGEVYYALRKYQLAQKDFQRAVEIKKEDDKFITGTKVLSAVVLGADKQDQYQNPELGALYADLMYAQKALNNDMYEVSYKKALEYNSHMYLPDQNKAEITKINCPQKYSKTFNPKGVDAVIASVIEDIEKGSYVEAVYKLPKITGEYPDYYLGYYLTGVVMYGMEHYDEAIEAFNKAILLNPDDFESYASLGKLYYTLAEKYFDTKYRDKSVYAFKKALALNPNCNTYHYYIGLNDLLSGKYEDSVSSFKRAILIKNNDYNSKYYKAIAQYLQKDYEGAIEESTGLLYRRVSNYNSVLYLRALSYYRLKRYDSAIADIEKIHHNMDDIYNLDIRKLSPKEKTLECYLHYLQSRIDRDNGLGAKSDLEKAYKNPIIALLDTRRTDYEHSNYRLTAVDIDTQYDYLRTTFDDLGVSFVYQAPDYKIVKNPNSPVVQPSEPVIEEKQPTVVVKPSVEHFVPTDEITAPVQSIGLIENNNYLAVQQPSIVDFFEASKLTPQEEKDMFVPEVKQEVKITEVTPIVEAQPEVKQEVAKEIVEEVKSVAQISSSVDVKQEEENKISEVDKTPQSELVKEVSEDNSETQVSTKHETEEETEEEGAPTSLGNNSKVISPESLQVEEIVNQIIEMKNIPDKEYVFVFDENTLIMDSEDEEEKTPSVAEFVAQKESAGYISAPVNKEIPLVAQQAPMTEIPVKIEAPEEKVEEVVNTVSEIQNNAISSATESANEKVEQVVQNVSENIEVSTAKTLEQTVSEVDKVKQEVLNQIEEDLKTLQDYVNQNTQKEVQEQVLPESPIDLLKEEVSQAVKEQTKSTVEAVETTALDVQNSANNFVEKIVETTANSVAAIETFKPSKSLVNEKHAVVNMDDFDVKNRKSPVINEDDEVVFLPPDSFIQKAERKINDNLSKISLTSQNTETPSNPLNKKFEGDKNVEVNITPEADNLSALAAKNTSDNKGVTLVENQGKHISQSLEETLDKPLSEAQLVVPEDVIVPDNIKQAEKTFDEKSEVVKPLAQELKDQTAHAVPDYIQPDESVEEQKVTEEEVKPVKVKKSKKNKSNDNLILAVGGNPEDYEIPEPKQPKIKEKKVKAKKVKEEKLAETPEVAEVAEPISTNDFQIAEASPAISEVTTEEKEAVKRVKKTKKQKEDKIQEKVVSDKVESEESQPIQNVDEVSDEVQEPVEKVKNPKKASFFKRLFSRKKSKEVENQAETVSEPEVHDIEE